MKEEFIKKYNNHEYISNDLYLNVLANYSDAVPSNFNIDTYNDIVLEKLYLLNKDYFDNFYKDIDPNIKLDKEQCKAILSDEKYSLIIAGAGTGKTTTMASKVKYLVEKKNVLPEKILVLSYTRKATEELDKSICLDFNIPAHVTTFHSLGYEYIREIFNNRKCVILDRNKKREIFLEYFKNLYLDKNKITEIINNFDTIKQMKNFVFSKFFIDNYQKFNTYDELIEYYVSVKLKEAKTVGTINLIKSWIERQLQKDENIISINGDYVKSAGEAVIANFLYKRGLSYSYEEAYPELMENNIIYKPDFTIDYAGEKIYIEYFGLEDENYNKIKLEKEKYHKEHNNKFIEIERTSLSNIVRILDNKLRELNVEYNERTNEEIYEHILRLNPLSQVYPFEYFMYSSIKYLKSSAYREDKTVIKKYIMTLKGEEKQNVMIEAKYFLDFYNYYSNKLYGGEYYYFDFDDLLYYAVKYIEKLTSETHLLFDYIIIDEYQDISNIKYELTMKTAKRNDAKVFAVGDDWQSIYSFSGSRIEYIYNFTNYFKGAKLFKINKTYRNSQELINLSGQFIMKNNSQIKKDLVSDKHIDKPIIIKTFDGTKSDKEEINLLKNTILEIYGDNPDHRILILGRTNRIIDNLYDDESFFDGIESSLVFKNYEDIDIEAMTMHKSKGLTFDDVIIIGLNTSFPSVKTGMTWIEKLYRNEVIDEGIPFAEERRLFYVALTRTKNHVYLLCDKNLKKDSEFISEIYGIMKGDMGKN